MFFISQDFTFNRCFDCSYNETLMFNIQFIRLSIFECLVVCIHTSIQNFRRSSRSGRTCTDCQGDLKRRSRAHLASKGTQNAVPGPTWRHQGVQNAVPGPTWRQHAAKNAVPGPTWRQHVAKNAVPGPTWRHEAAQNAVPGSSCLRQAFKMACQLETIQNFCNCNPAAVPE